MTMTEQLPPALPMSSFQPFSWKDTHLKVYGDRFELITKCIVEERKKLENYIQRHPEFASSLKPVRLLADPPAIAEEMARAARKTGLGPMASVAGTLAQYGVEAALKSGTTEAIVENGGDMYIASTTPVTIGIYAGNNSIGAQLAFQIEPQELPLSICSSSSKMGHSLSFGNCELATVVAKRAALADSAATLVCNSICRQDDVERVLETVGAIPGIQGILVVKDSSVGLWGNLPQIVRNQDRNTVAKITRDPKSELRSQK